jgi:putative PIN family toxin of toxin-antitoxin system
MRLVLDTNIVLSGFFWDGSPRKLLFANPSLGVSLFSTPLLNELEEVVSRRKFARRIAASPLSIDQLLARYKRLATTTRPLPIPRIAPDSDDDVAIGTALAANADFIVTGDLALLSVGQYEGVRIVSVSEALKSIAGG